MSLESMKKRLINQGGAAQQNRMMHDKLKSMLYATKYSYQAAELEHYPQSVPFKGLMNSVSQTEDRDTKMISCEWKDKIGVGSVIKWKNTNSMWIVFLQDRTELSYFKGRCRRCDYVISWVDKNRRKIDAPASVIGPTNPSLSSYNGETTIIRVPTGNLVILVADSPDNHAFFSREQTFFIKHKTYKVSQIDNISMPGIIQINATEFVTNLVEDDPKEELRNKWNIQPVIEHHLTEYGIEGPRIIKPYYKATYHTFIPDGVWTFEKWDSRYSPYKFLTDTDKQEVTVIWESTKTGQFTLNYTSASGKVYSFVVTVESMM